MRLGSQWEDLRDGWSEARIRVTLDDPARSARAARLLSPLQPFEAGPGVLTFRVVGRPQSVRRLLERLDDERIGGTLELIDSDPMPAQTAAAAAPTLRASWEAALAAVPADWSDLLAEIELWSSDWLEQAAVELVPINPRRDGQRLVLRFRAARRFGYGASPQMVARALARCDEAGVRGSVRILQTLSNTRPVGTQGPVFLLDGRAV